MILVDLENPHYPLNHQSIERSIRRVKRTQSTTKNLINFPQFGDNQIYRSLRDESPLSDVSGRSLGSGHGIPLISAKSPAAAPKLPNADATMPLKEAQPCTSNGHFRKHCDKKVTNNGANGSHSACKCADTNTRRRNNSANGILPLMNHQPTITLLANAHVTDALNGMNGTPPSKTQSLPTNSSISELDAVVLNALRIPADELAGQITLLDFPAFSDIQPDELTSCAWTKKNKYTVAPNIVAFTKRFNHTSFWTIHEILSGPTPKRRAEIMSHFIKVRNFHPKIPCHKLILFLKTRSTNPGGQEIARAEQFALIVRRSFGHANGKHLSAIENMGSTQ